MNHVARKTLCKFATPVLEGKTPRFLDQVEHWLEHKGEEWLSERWKVIRNAALLVRSGKPDDAVVLMKEKGVAVRSDQPVSCGPFGLIQLAYIAAESPYRIRTTEALLRGYTALTLPSESRKQVAKARSAITGTSSADPKVINAMVGLIPTVLRDQPRSSLGKEDCRPDMRGIVGIRSYYTGYIQVPSKLKKLPFVSAVMSALVVGHVPQSVILLCGDNPMRRKAELFQEKLNFPSAMGKISYLQEGGCKARVICLPSTWMQAYYKPLQDELISRIGKLETPELQERMKGISCVLDQNRGAYILQQWMNEGKNLFSFDLSSATDRFSLDYQLGYLKASGLSAWIDPVRDAARGVYHHVRDDKEWMYAVGQPMGLNFSFPLFHLSHQTLLESLARSSHHNNSKEKLYAVLGDDVLIADQSLAKNYQATMEKMDITISKEKSYEGVSVQSFAGFTGISSTRGIQVFRPFKHGADFAIRGREVNLLATLGPEVRKWSGWWSRSFDQLNRTYPLRNPDLSPVLPLSDDKGLRSGNPGSRWFSAVTQRCLNEDVTMSFLDPTGSQRQKFPFSIGYLGEGADWNRLWSVLLHEKDSILHNNFDINQYVTEERRKVRTNQISSDPLIMDQKLLDEVRRHVHGTVNDEGKWAQDTLKWFESMIQLRFRSWLLSEF